MNKAASYRRLIQFFLQGLLVIAPIAITIWAIAAAFSFVDGILPNIMHSLFPSLMEDKEGNIRQIPGLGFLVVMTKMYGGLVLLHRMIWQTLGLKIMWLFIYRWLILFQAMYILFPEAGLRKLPISVHRKV